MSRFIWFLITVGIIAGIVFAWVIFVPRGQLQHGEVSVEEPGPPPAAAAARPDGPIRQDLEPRSTPVPNQQANSTGEINEPAGGQVQPHAARPNQDQIASADTAPAATRTQSGARAADEQAAGVATVVWISVDGVRPDYLSRGETPWFDRMMEEGLFSLELSPVFPSLTFPSHVSQATGVGVNRHGVPTNTFITGENLREHRYPGDSRLLEAEPIWITAPRQGVRTAVFDWPLSHAQRGEVRSDYFGDRFVSGLADEERLNQLLEMWRADVSDAPLRLVMGYVVGPDSVGHRYGPDAPQPIETLENVDRLLADFVTQCLELWEQKRNVADEFYLLITTDHGMSRVDWLVNLEMLAGTSEDTDIRTAVSGNVAHLFFEDRHMAERFPQRLDTIISKVHEQQFARAYRRSDLPEHWQFDHPTRTGDIVIVLDTHYTFSARGDKLLTSAVEGGGPLGMHGYDIQDNPEMLGILMLWRAEHPLGGVDMGPVDSLQMHATVAHLLGIHPAPEAHPHGIFADDAE